MYFRKYIQMLRKIRHPCCTSFFIADRLRCPDQFEVLNFAIYNINWGLRLFLCRVASRITARMYQTLYFKAVLSPASLRPWYGLDFRTHMPSSTSYMAALHAIHITVQQSTRHCTHAYKHASLSRSCHETLSRADVLLC